MPDENSRTFLHELALHQHRAPPGLNLLNSEDSSKYTRNMATLASLHSYIYMKDIVAMDFPAENVIEE